MQPHLNAMPASAPFLLGKARSRAVTAENPTGKKSAGAQASPGDDPHCTNAAAHLGKGWKVRPCLRNLQPGESITLADLTGPGIVTHIWMTVLTSVHRWLAFEVTYDDAEQPSIRTPLGDFFANGLDGQAQVSSAPITVAPLGGMNSYWPMPFRKRIRITLRNDGPAPISEIFYQIDYMEQDLPDEAGYLHAAWRRALTTRDNPEHVILDRVELPAGTRGRYVGTYLVWNQLSNGWWGEGEVKFFIDGDPDDAPTICGTGTEDYFGGAWGFIAHHPNDQRPVCYSTPYLGYPQALYDATPSKGQRVPAHALYRWHLPDPVCFDSDLRVTVQALGWWPTLPGDQPRYQPLTDDIASTAFWYQSTPGPSTVTLPPLHDRLPR